MTIPKIIHHTWKSNKIPIRLSLFYKSWQKNHPEWEFRLWTDKDNYKLVKNHFKEFLPYYLRLPTNIQRADIIRYFFLYKFGGVYVDLDFHSFKSMDELIINDYDCVLSYENEIHNIIHNKTKIISNAFMATTPKGKFFKKLIEEIYSNANLLITRNDVLDSTGPFFLTNFIIENNFLADQNIKILDPKYFFPLSGDECDTLMQINATGRKKLSKISPYGLHYHLGTWYKPNMITKVNDRFKNRYLRIINNIKKIAIR